MQESFTGEEVDLLKKEFSEEKATKNNAAMDNPTGEAMDNQSVGKEV